MSYEIMYDRGILAGYVAEAYPERNGAGRFADLGRTLCPARDAQKAQDALQKLNLLEDWTYLALYRVAAAGEAGDSARMLQEMGAAERGVLYLSAETRTAPKGEYVFRTPATRWPETDDARTKWDEHVFVKLGARRARYTIALLSIARDVRALAGAQRKNPQDIERLMAHAGKLRGAFIFDQGAMYPLM